jgi:hypothetical protein
MWWTSVRFVLCSTDGAGRRIVNTTHRTYTQAAFCTPLKHKKRILRSHVVQPLNTPKVFTGRILHNSSVAVKATAYQWRISQNLPFPDTTTVILLFGYASRQEGIWKSGGMAPRILNFRTNWKRNSI